MHKYLYILKYIHIYSNIYIYITYILLLSLSLSLSDLVWRLPECWCWQMWQLRGANFWGLERRKNVVPIRSTFKVCLVCECIHALCLSNFARPSFPSFFGWSCWFDAQLNKIAKQTDRWMKIISTRPCLRLRTNLGPRIAFWCLIWVIFWSLFWVPFLGAVLGP